MKKSLLLLPALYLFFYACHKDNTDCPPDLPCATQTGENTFGCYINGKPWVAKVEPYILDPTAHKIIATYDEPNYGSINGNFFSITGSYYGDSLSSIIIAFAPFLQTGSVSLSNLDLFRFRFRTPNSVFDIDGMSNYNIEITKLDTFLNIISGQFEFLCISNGDSITITDGRFDVKYDPY